MEKPAVAATFGTDPLVDELPFKTTSIGRCIYDQRRVLLSLLLRLHTLFLSAFERSLEVGTASTLKMTPAVTRFRPLRTTDYHDVHPERMHVFGFPDLTHRSTTHALALRSAPSCANRQRLLPALLDAV